VPFDRPHSIVGNFGEPRTTFFGPPRPGSLFGRGLFFFHNGIDVPAPADTPVYAIASGIADLPDPTVVRVRSSDGPTFEYWHIEPVVKPGQVVVARRTIVGRIRRKPGHVHVKEVAGGMVTNPLAPGGIGPSPDRTRPRIDTITFRRPGSRTLLTQLGREPTLEEIAEQAHLPLGQAQDVRRASRVSASLDQPIGEQGDVVFGDFVASEGPLPEEEVEVSLRSEALIEVLSILEDREREVLILRYGLADEEPKTLEEIGHVLAVTRERVRQIESAALERMASFGEMRDITG
jgi:RNA polymerase sigma factor (sigma-70 family)